jgi:hypothetical protein
LWSKNIRSRCQEKFLAKNKRLVILMIDKVMYKILGAIDDFFLRIENFFTAPRCQCKLKNKRGKNVKKM